MLSRLPGFEWQHFEQWYFGGAPHAPSTLLFARPNAAIHLDLGSISHGETLELWNNVARWRIRSGAQLGMQILLWILATAVFVIAALKNANDGRRLAAVLLMPIVMTAGPAVAYGLKVATARLPQKLDPYLYNVDRALFSISPSSALARVFVSPQSNASGNVSGAVAAPTFRQIVGSGPVTLGRRPIGQPLPSCQSRVCLTGGG